MPTATDQLVQSSVVPLPESSLIVPLNESLINSDMNGSPPPPPTTPNKQAPPPETGKELPPTSPSPPPPITKSSPPPLVGLSNSKTPALHNSPPAPSPENSSTPPPPSLASPPPPPPPLSPSNSTSQFPPGNPFPTQAPAPPASPPPFSQMPLPPSSPSVQNSPTSPSSSPSPPPPEVSPPVPSPPPPPLSFPPQNVSGVVPVTAPLTYAPPTLASPAIPGVGLPPPPLTETPSSTNMLPPPPTTTEKPTHSPVTSGSTTDDSSSLTKSNSDSSSTLTAKNSTDSVGLARGAAVGITLAGVAVIVVAIFFLVSRKKKRRSECLAIHYAPTHGYSMKPDGYYYGQATPMGNSSNFLSPYTSQPPFPSVSGTYGSFHGHSSYSGSPEVVGLGNSKSYFTYEEIAEMTNRFSRQNLLGEGGFGCVYKGWLTDGRAVAVKQLKDGSGQGEREFRAEVEIISRVHHRHLVSLVGYCIADNHRSLVYEFLPNKTLEYHLHGMGLPVMEWSKRLRIAIGAARGLAYLHDDCHPKIIHRDIKTANILLDETFEAQVADFGLARLTNDTHTHVSTRVVGTFGYMAPEYASSGKLTDKSDVFSFGVVILELITGRKPVDISQPLGEESLVEWARPLLVDALESGNFDILVDPRLDGNYSKSEMYRMMEAAASCVRHSAAKRPRMVQVLRALDTVGELSDLSNGLKFGQSTVFDSRQYSADIQQFRRMAFGSDSYISDRSYTEEFDSDSMIQSRECSSPEALCRPLNSGRHNSREYPSSNEFSPNPLGRRPSESYGSRRFSGRLLH